MFKTPFPLIALGFVALSLVGTAAQADVTLTGQAIGGWGYWDASALSVSKAHDLVLGLAPTHTDYYGTFEAAGGSTLPFTDGKTATDGSGDTSQPTYASNALFDLNGNWYTTYTLGAGANGEGYDLSSIVVTTGHQDARVNQGYDILISDTLDPNAVFTSLSGGQGFFYRSPDGAGAAQTMLTDSLGGTLASHVEQVKFQTLDGGNGVYREFGVFGATTPAPVTPLAAVPEPSTLAPFVFAALGLLGLTLRARRTRTA